MLMKMTKSQLTSRMNKKKRKLKSLMRLKKNQLKRRTPNQMWL